MLHSKGLNQTVILIVKSSFALLVGMTVLASTLSACGQTGPLYMPKPPAKPVPATSNPVPPSATPASQQ
jgi:predicted small lipoprotein YifL